MKKERILAVLHQEEQQEKKMSSQDIFQITEEELLRDVTGRGNVQSKMLDPKKYSLPYTRPIPHSRALFATGRPITETPPASSQIAKAAGVSSKAAASPSISETVGKIIAFDQEMATKLAHLRK